MKRKMAGCNLCEPFVKIKEKHEENVSRLEG